VGEGYVNVAKSGRVVMLAANHDEAIRCYHLLIAHDVAIGQLSCNLFIASEGLPATPELFVIPKP